MTVDDPADGIIGFCELYCQARGFDHVSLARPGATNFCIRLQIERAIDDRADFAVVGLTSSDRLDLVIDVKDDVQIYQLYHILYQGYRAAAARHIDQTQIKLVCDTVNNIVHKTNQNLVPPKQTEALKSYMAYLHNSTLSSQKDYYMVSDGVRKLQQSSIPFVLLPGWLAQFDWSWVKDLWPKSKASPYDMPYGCEGWTNPIKFTSTHNPSWAHQEFCETLLTITKHWS